MINRFATRILFVSLLALSVQACSSGVKLTRQDAEGLTAVAISPDVAGVGAIHYTGSADGLSTALGPLVGAMAAAAEMSAQERLNVFAQQQGIEIKEMVREEFSKQVAASPMFAGKLTDSGANATFKLDIKIYGLAMTPSFMYRPLLGVNGTLEDASGKVLWQRYAYLTNLSSKIPARSLADYFEGDNMRESISLLTREVITDMVADFGGQAEAVASTR